MQTGEERCANCGCPVPLPNVAGAALHWAESPEASAFHARYTDAQFARMRARSATLPDAPEEPPPILGGQGRDASEVVDDGDGIVRVLIIAGFLVAIVAVGVWAAGGGR